MTRAGRWASRLLWQTATRGLARAAGLSRADVDVEGRRAPLLAGGRGPAVVALHGFGSMKESWLPIAPVLARHARLYLVDLPGFGASAPAAPAEAVRAAQARWVEALLDALGLAQAHLVGHSMGGAICLTLARQAPDRVASLALVGAALPVVEASEVITRTDAGERPLVPRTLAAFDALMDLVLARPVPLLGAARPFLAPDQVARADALGAFFEVWYPDYRAETPEQARLADIDVPTLIVHGARDRVIHPACAAAAATIPDARHLELADVGHMPTVEAPLRTARALRAFLGSVG